MGVPRTILCAAAVAALFAAGSAPAAAQTNEPDDVATLEAVVGLDGFVATGRPTVVSATISTPVLLAGRVRVTGAGVAVSRPVEVPAGAQQTYELTMPPLSDDDRILVELLDADGEVVAERAVSVRSSSDELAVGVVGDAALVDSLSRVRIIVTDRPVGPSAVPDDVPASTLDALDYLVVAPGGADRLSDAVAWAERGGALVVDAALAAELPSTEPAPAPTGVQGVVAAPIGAGELVVVESLSTRSGDDWAAILRPVALDLGSRPEFGLDAQRNGLIQAASESGTRQVPSLPWLLFAIVGFAIVVGPVNFLVLSRLGKRDLAWFTIPVVAAVAVLGFWVAGRQRIAGTTVSHASIVVEDGGTESRSGLIVAAGSGGMREMSFGESSLVYPEPSSFLAETTELELVDSTTARVDLDRLAFTGVGLAEADPSLTLPDVSIADGMVEVDNRSNLRFWGWGLVRGPAAVLGEGELAPDQAGSVGTIAVEDDPGATGRVGIGFVDAMMNERGLWNDPELSNGLWAMAPMLDAATDDAALYFVGLTQEYRPEVVVDGAAVTSEGPTMVVIRVEGGTRAEGLSRAELVGTGFVNWVEGGPQPMIATDQMTVSFSVPGPGVTPRLRDSLAFGAPPQRYEAWDWSAGSFVEISEGEPLETRFVSPDGLVYVRLVGDEAGDDPFSPGSLTLEWETA